MGVEWGEVFMRAAVMFTVFAVLSDSLSKPSTYTVGIVVTVAYACGFIGGQARLSRREVDHP